MLNSISFAFAVIPYPPTTLIVASPSVAPPVKPAPATTAVISPSPNDVISEYFASLCPPAVEPSWTLTVLFVVSIVISPASPVNEPCWVAVPPVSYTHLTLPTTPYV